jgi:hypothetical protein
MISFEQFTSPGFHFSFSQILLSTGSPPICSSVPEDVFVVFIAGAVKDATGTLKLNAV